MRDNISLIIAYESSYLFLPPETCPAADLAMMGLGIFSLSISNPTLISPMRMRSLWLAVLRLYLLMGADLGRGLGPRFFGCRFRVSVSIRFWIEHARSVIDLSDKEEDPCFFAPLPILDLLTCQDTKCTTQKESGSIQPFNTPFSGQFISSNWIPFVNGPRISRSFVPQ